ncbi:ShlB/FhaC/HecB family hemolysin secretion/activation protein [Azospirillum ramasamyi]|uniref:ShlB/FhaC/HecB family hemolysin secretion/activation protein n=1 Tax=Azospirillum ramasamyi TaxID=682998 RepID=A0A2U9SCJ7_9PROT|nr:ShlB/FhaC/HecB family hemolysin secretion/activation protein [Azospirillum ramasamyi]AWU96346.1 ShlB/FhaC/HecB family hemolysin secretion/activation protein [Azospirillum ramasamyi]
MPATFFHLSFGALALGTLALTGGGALAQSLPVERNPPPRQAEPSNTLSIDPGNGAAADRTPLGVQLSAIRLIGRDAAVPSAGRAAVGTGQIVTGRIGIGGAETDQALRDELRTALSGFIGQPLSMALIADAQAAIAGVYRDAGYPFVSVSIPPQEVTAGTLTLRVIEFALGKISLQGEADGQRSGRGATIAAGIRGAEGERIEVARIDEDLRWLNRYPYRRVQGIFSPGDGLGRSDLTLELVPQKPWQVFAGYANTGTRETDRNRFFLGAGFALPQLGDAYGSWQTTGSRDLFAGAGRLFPGDGERARYLSHSARFVLPTAARQAIEISPNFVATRQRNGSFTSDNNFFELPVYYRAALSSLLPGVHFGDVLAGVEAKTLDRRTFFDGAGLGRARADVVQIGLGWDRSWSDRLGATGLSLIGKINPGGVMANNDDAGWTAFSNGRVRKARYAYVTGVANRSTDLGGGISLTHELTVQYAGQALPDTEQIALGGLYAVRGYDLGNGAADRGVILRNELRLPGVPLVRGDILQPFAFVDGAVGKDIGARRDLFLAGTGLGVDYRVVDHVTTSLTAAVALADEGKRQAGPFDLTFRVFATY